MGQNGSPPAGVRGWGSPRKKGAENARLGGLRIPVILLLFVLGLTALASLQILLNFAGMRNWLPRQGKPSLDLGTSDIEDLGVPRFDSGESSNNDDDDDEFEVMRNVQPRGHRLSRKAPAARQYREEAEVEFGEQEAPEEDAEIENQFEDAGADSDAEEEFDEDARGFEAEPQRRKRAPAASASSLRKEPPAASRKSAKATSAEEQAEEYDSEQDTRAALAEKAEPEKDIQTPVRSSSTSPYVPVPQLAPRMPKSFTYFKGACHSFCKSLIRAGYTMLPGMTSPAHPEFVIISYKSLNKYANLKSSILNQIGYGSSCIGGGKGKQLACKEEFSLENGCEYRNLGVQPEQWNLRYPTSCRAFFDVASLPENKDQIWIVKPGGSFHGSGIKLYNGIEQLRSKFRCTLQLSDGMIVQRYVAKPALFSGYKFDFRTYMLIASMNPFVVFYHDGFIRRSEHLYDTSAASLGDAKKHITNSRSQSSENHFFSFQQLQERLTAESGFPSDFMDKVIRPHAMRTTNFMFHAAARKFKHRSARHQLFALDWMLDGDGKLHLLEANGNPQTSDYPAELGLTPRLWTSMVDLVHMVQVETKLLPHDFSVQSRYAFEGWKLVYNELEAVHHNAKYNPCSFNSYAESGHQIFGFSP